MLSFLLSEMMHNRTKERVYINNIKIKYENMTKEARHKLTVYIQHKMKREVSHVSINHSTDSLSLSVWRSVTSLCVQSDPYWTVETLSAKDRSRIGNQSVCSLVEMLRLAARANSSALLNIRKPPAEHPRYRSWFMDTLWAVQKAGISQKRVRTVGPFIIILS